MRGGDLITRKNGGKHPEITWRCVLQRWKRRLSNQASPACTCGALWSIIYCMVETKKVVADVKEGHAEHTKPADSQEGLRGKFTRPIHITFLGAGSGFCPNLCRDVLLIPGADR